MPYNYDPNVDPDKEQEQGQNSAPSLASGSQVTGGSSITNASAPQQGSGTSSGSYQNLNSYLEANKGSDFGNQFTGKIQGEVDAAKNAQNEAAEQFKKQSDAGSAKYDENLANQAFSDPYAFSQDQNNVTAFQNMLNAQYRGPQSYEESGEPYQKAYGATKKANDVTQAAQTEPGRFALLNNYFGNPNYTQGQQSLDNLLLQGNQQTGLGIQQARNKANEAQMAFQNQSPELQQYAAQNMANTAPTAAKTRAAGEAALSGFQGTVQSEADMAAQRNAEIAQIRDALQGRHVQTLSPQILQKLGIGAGDATYATNPLSYFQGQEVSPEGFVDPAAYQKYQALGKLLGDESAFNFDESKLGSNIGAPDYSFDTGKFRSDAAKGKAAYENAFKSAKYDPFSTLPLEQQFQAPQGLTIDPNAEYNAQKAIQNQINASPNSTAMRMQQLKDIENYINSLKKTYGVNDYLGG